MIALYIVLGILGLLLLLAFLPVTLTVDYQNGFCMDIRTLFFTWIRYPWKKKKVNLRKYRKKKKKTVQPEKKETTPDSRTLTEDLAFLKTLLGTLVKKGLEFSRLRVARIHIVVATGDAAKTAILFGAVRGALSICLEILNQFKRHSACPGDDIYVLPDFTGEKTTVDFKVRFTMHAWQALYVLFCTSLDVLKQNQDQDQDEIQNQNTDQS